MKLEVTTENYAAIVVELDTFVNLPKMNTIKHAIIFNNSVIISKDAVKGEIGLFFPAETCLDPEFLKHNNLYRKAEWGNVNPDKTGFFELHGRVRTCKFQKFLSEGFYMPISCLDYLGLDLSTLSVGDTFNLLNGTPICKKYTVPKKESTQPNKQKAAKKHSRLVDNQFRFHFDTSLRVA